MSDNEKPTAEHGAPSFAPQRSINQVGDEPPHHGMSTSKYIATRFSSLRPPLTRLPNPIMLILHLNRHQWAFFGIAFFAWVCAAALTPAGP